MSFSRIKRGWAKAACRWVAIVVLAITPATGLAAQPSDEHDIYDARIEGYAGSRTLPGGGNALTWIAFVVLAVVACAGLFKDAKRTHLD